MIVAGLTDEGLVIKTFEEVFTSKEQRAVELFSDITPQGDPVDTSENTVLGRMIGIASSGEYDLWEALQFVHDSFNPNTATGIALDNLVAIGGLQRLSAQATSIPVYIIGKNNLVLNTDFTVSSSFNRKIYALQKSTTFGRLDIVSAIFEPVGVSVGSLHSVVFNFDGVTDVLVEYESTTNDIEQFCIDFADYLELQFPEILTSVIGEFDGKKMLGVTSNDYYLPFTLSSLSGLVLAYSGKIVYMLAQELGDIIQPVNTIDIVPNYSVDSTDIIIPLVTNISEGIRGRLAERDEELRERFRNTKFRKASNILDSLIDALRELSGVDDVIVYENDQNVFVGDLPPHSFMAVVLGGEENQIAKTIWNKKPLGITSVGSTAVTVFDSQGLTKIINYQKPTTVDISISVVVTKVSPMPSTAATTIKQNIVNFSDDLYRIGDDVIYSRFYTPVNAVAGHYVNSLTIGVIPLGADPADPDRVWEDTSNISIGNLQVARIKPDNIRVTVLDTP